MGWHQRKVRGGIWVPNSRNIAQAGVSDSAEEAFKYMRAVIPENEVSAASINNYITYAPKMIDFLEQQTCLTCTPVQGYAD